MKRRRKEAAPGRNPSRSSGNNCHQTVSRLENKMLWSQLLSKTNNKQFTSNTHIFGAGEDESLLISVNASEKKLWQKSYWKLQTRKSLRLLLAAFLGI